MASNSSTKFLFAVFFIISVFSTVRSSEQPEVISDVVQTDTVTFSVDNANFAGVGELNSMETETRSHHRRHVGGGGGHHRKSVPGVTYTIPMPVDLIKRTDGRIYLNHAAKEFLDAHNALRRFFREKPFTWNKTLAKYARDWSDKIRQTCSMEHSGGPYGENLFWGSGNRWRAVDAVQNWAMEHYYYDRNSHSCLAGRMCGHYTQMVWKGSASLGCAKTKCKQGGTIIVCNYDPPGNYLGENPFD